MTNVVDINARLERIGSRLDNSGGPPDNGDMEARVAKLESIAVKTNDRLISIDKDIGIIKTQMDGIVKHYATKADLMEAKNSIIMWIVSAMLLAQLLPALLKKFGL